MPDSSVKRREKKDRRDLAKSLKQLNQDTDYEEGLRMIRGFEAGAEKARKDLNVYELNLAFLQSKKSYKEIRDLSAKRTIYGHEITVKQAKILGNAFKELGDYSLARKYYEIVCKSDVPDKASYVADLHFVTAKCERSGPSAKTEDKEGENIPESGSVDNLDNDDVPEGTTENVNVDAGEASNSCSDKNIKLPPNVSVRMKLINDICYEGTFEIGTETMKKGFIQSVFRELVNLDEKGQSIPYQLKIEMVVPSLDASCHFLMVEPVKPLLFFFKEKLETFNSVAAGGNKREWWKFIEKTFGSIFRNIIYCTHTIHSRKKIINKIREKVYVTCGSIEGRVLHTQEGKYAVHNTKVEVKDIALCMKSVITSFQPMEERKLLFDDLSDYGLPPELQHFFKCLEGATCARLPSTWLLDHSYFWSAKQRRHFVVSLNDVIREQLVKDRVLRRCLDKIGAADWQTSVKKDILLRAIYEKKGDSLYMSTDGARLVNFAHAFFSHANEKEYEDERGQLLLTPSDMVSRLGMFLPRLYPHLLDALKLYVRQADIVIADFLIALHRCSPLYADSDE